MRIESISKIFFDFKAIFNSNPRGSNIGIITNDYCGEHFLVEKITRYMESQPRSKVIIVEALEIKTLESFCKLLENQILEDLGIDATPNLSCASYSELIIKYSLLLSENNMASLILIIKNYENLDIEVQYKIASQLRNTREKIKMLAPSIGFHSFIIGQYSFFKHSQMCNKYGTSFIIDDIFYIGESSLPEIELTLFIKNDQTKLIEDNLNNIYEVVGGNIGLIDTFIYKEKISGYLFDIKNRPPEFDFIRNRIFEKYKSICDDGKMIIKELVNGNSRVIKYNELLEELYLSGIVKIIPKRNEYIVNIRSWFCEILLREIFKDDHSIYSQWCELMPPSYFSNIQAYKIISEIENKLRNILIFKLSEHPYSEHPLELLDCLGKTKKAGEGEKYFLYDWCKHKITQLDKVYNVNVYKALVSQIDLQDIEQIFLSEEKIEVEPFCALSSLFSNILPDSKRFRILLSKLRKIRNPIAHNNLIDINLIEELNKIKEEIFRKLKS